MKIYLTLELLCPLPLPPPPKRQESGAPLSGLLQQLLKEHLSLKGHSACQFAFLSPRENICSWFTFGSQDLSMGLLHIRPSVKFIDWTGFSGQVKKVFVELDFGEELSGISLMGYGANLMSASSNTLRNNLDFWSGASGLIHTTIFQPRVASMQSSSSSHLTLDV